MFLKPTWVLEDLSAIDMPFLERLKLRGITGMILDLDNTLIVPKTAYLQDEVRAWLRLVQTQNFKLFVVSNNRNAAYVDQTADLLGIPHIGQAGKPRLRSLHIALETMGLASHEVVVVGDRPLTDIWAGQRLGALTILIPPLNQREPWYIKSLRKLERLAVNPF